MAITNQHSEQPFEPDRFMRLPEVEAATGYRRSTLYEKAGRGEFPKPYRLGERAVAWSAREVSDWIEARKRESREAA